MKRLNYNQINSLMGRGLTPTQKMMGQKVKLYKPAPIYRGVEPGNNDPCSCGSGKKYKLCCKNT
jgi:uncharacterized protein YecA (UPF0149 family)